MPGSKSIHEVGSYRDLTSFLEHFYQNAGLYTVMLKNQAFYERIFGMLLDIITIWGEERKSKGRPFHVLNEVIASSTLGIVTWWLKEKTPYSPHYMAKQISLLVNGEK
ncbi:TetR-like C-terminal domain-containing protein [Paenibacillus apiarius]|uniref:TetR-like C-terminal domain-containing protein n=1 Tax=Paenibacillus apiarius TaxID=46240 RepID=UPI00197F9C83|nr:TetR-like C-terminal domain-containing protein [Paenibacillus apiarius]MBN3527062.1 TetR family transcriptional regulator C-terminal domain-containing protein [Paenibacillus apiarius]